MSQAATTTVGTSPATSRRVPFALAALVVAAILTAIGTFRGDDDHSLRTWLVVLAAVSLVVFWTGLPPIFAGGAALLALAARERGAETGMASAALVLGALTVVAEALAAFIG